MKAAVYIINRIPLTTIGNKTPYELLYNKQPSLSHLRVVGCLCFATNFLKGDKFAPRAREAVLLGYAATQKGYKLYDMKSKTIFVSRDVVFHEQLFPFQAHNIDTEEGMHFLDLGGTEMNGECETPTTTTTEHSNGKPSHSEVTSSPPSCMLEEEHVEEEHVTDVHDQVVLRKSHRTVRPPIWQADYVLPRKATRNCLYSIGDVVDYNSISVPYKSYLTRFSQEQEPKTYHEAVKDNRWIEAMQSEIQALESYMENCTAACG